MQRIEFGGSVSNVCSADAADEDLFLHF